MMQTPAHKQTDPAKKPGQIINPINTDIMDDMGRFSDPVVEKPNPAEWPHNVYPVYIP